MAAFARGLDDQAHRADAEAMTFEHLAYEQVEAYVDGNLSDVDRELADGHLEACATCMDDVADLRRVRAELLSTQTPAAARAAQPIWMRVAQIAALVIAALAINMFVQQQRARSAVTTTASVPSAPGPTAPAAPPSLAPPLPSANTTPDPEHALIERTLAAGRIELPAKIRALTSAAGTLLGEVSASSELLPLTPTGTAVATRTPTFSWHPATGATSYGVAVFDERFAEVASVATVNGTAWTPTVALPRGVALSWQVTAHLPKGDVTAPAPPQPEARFLVLDDTTAEAMRSAQQRLAGEPLELGIVLANAGLIVEATRAFELAAKDPATAQQAARLLAGIKKR